MSNSTEDSSSFTGYMFYEFCDHINVYEDKLNMILKTSPSRYLVWKTKHFSNKKYLKLTADHYFICGTFAVVQYLFFKPQTQTQTLELNNVS